MHSCVISRLLIKIARTVVRNGKCGLYLYLVGIVSILSLFNLQAAKV